MSRKLSESNKKIIAFKQDYKCFICKKILPPSFQVDHIIPHSISLDDTEENLQALCPNCHSIKTQRENSRIYNFKKLQNKQNQILCWFCLEINNNKNHRCDKIVKHINVNDKKSNTLINEDYLDKFKFLSIQTNLDDNLNIEICLYNFCIYVNNVIVKLRNDDIYLEDIGEAIFLATRSKKYSKKISCINVDIIHKDKSEDDLNNCIDFLEENLFDYIPKRILVERPFVCIQAKLT